MVDLYEAYLAIFGIVSLERECSYSSMVLIKIDQTEIMTFFAEIRYY